MSRLSRIFVFFIFFIIILWILLFNFKNPLNKQTNINEALEFVNKVQRPKYDVNCKQILEFNETEIQIAKRILSQLKIKSNISGNYDYIPALPDSNFIFDKSMCNVYKQLRGFDSYKITDFEKRFPLAFIILTYNDVEQFERYLKAIYRPQNVYCIQWDILFVIFSFFCFIIKLFFKQCRCQEYSWS